LWGYFGLAALIYMLAPVWVSEDSPGARPPGRRFVQLTVSAFGAFVVSHIVMLFFWPWAQINPLLRPIEAVSVVSNFGCHAKVLLGGEYFRAHMVPWNYLPEYFLIKMPELVLAGIGLGAILAGRYLLKGKPENWKLKTFPYFLLVFSVLFPFAYVILKKSTLYDGIRHFLFIVPVLCVISGIAISEFIDIVNNKIKLNRIAWLLILVLVFLPQGYVTVKLHPYQYIYYNSLVGGLPGAEGDYETDYYAHSYREAAMLLLGHLRRTEGHSFEMKIYRVKIEGPNFPATYYLPENVNAVKNITLADYLISFTRWDKHKGTHGIPIATVSRCGVPLSVIKDVGTLY
jgi:hypothetical protein